MLIYAVIYLHDSSPHFFYVFMSLLKYHFFQRGSPDYPIKSTILLLFIPSPHSVYFFHSVHYYSAFYDTSIGLLVNCLSSLLECTL